MRIETIIVILIIYAIRKGNRRNELRPYSRDFGLRYVDENMRIAMREDASNYTECSAAPEFAGWFLYPLYKYGWNTWSERTGQVANLYYSCNLDLC